MGREGEGGEGGRGERREGRGEGEVNIHVNSREGRGNRDRKGGRREMGGDKREGGEVRSVVASAIVSSQPLTPPACK